MRGRQARRAARPPELLAEEAVRKEDVDRVGKRFCASTWPPAPTASGAGGRPAPAAAAAEAASVNPRRVDMPATAASERRSVAVALREGEAALEKARAVRSCAAIPPPLPR